MTITSPSRSTLAEFSILVGLIVFSGIGSHYYTVKEAIDQKAKVTAYLDENCKNIGPPPAAAPQVVKDLFETGYLCSSTLVVVPK